MKANDSVTTLTNVPSDLSSVRSQQMSQSIHRSAVQSPTSNITSKRNQYIANQRRQHLPVVNNDFRTQHHSSPFSTPVLLETLDGFFQTTENMEDEIMLPTKLKDMSIDELVFDNTVQPDNWHEIYTFIRDVRNQLQCTYPFADNENENNNTDSNNKQRKHSTDDEGIIVSLHNNNNQFSSASSVASSEEYEQSSTTSSSTTASYESIKDELKYHYYGLFRSLDNLTSMANRVRDKYREDSMF